MANPRESAPDSEEQKFKVKCQELRKRIAEVEESNEISSLALSRTRHAIRRLRLQYSVLLERLEGQVVQISEGETLDETEAMTRPFAPTLTDENLNFQQPKPAVATGRRGKNGVMSAAAMRRAARDPNLPKRPTNAYLMFCDREKDRARAQIEAKNPGKPATELTRVLTDLWKALSDEEKVPYLKLYEEDRQRYQREMVVYNKKKHEEAATPRRPQAIKLKLAIPGSVLANNEASTETPIEANTEANTETNVEVEAEEEDIDGEREDTFMDDEDADDNAANDTDVNVIGDD